MNSSESGGNISSILFMIVACSLFAVTSVIAKYLGNAEAINALHPLQISAGRFSFAFLSLLPFLIWKTPSYKGVPWLLHGGRSICGWLGVSCMFAAAARMPLAEASTISFLSPIATMILAIWILKEKVPGTRWIWVSLSFAGMVLITRPGTEAFQPAAFIALASACFMGIEAIFIKRLSDNEPPLRILSINNAIGALVAISVATTVWVTPTSEQWFLLFLLGSVMVTGQSLFIQSMKRGSASFVAPFMYTMPMFAAIYDFLIFGDFVSSLSAFGIFIIIGSAVIQSRQRTT